MQQHTQGDATGKAPEGVPFLISDNLKADGLRHGFFLRTGGVSEGIYASLNCGRGSNDAKFRVEENRARAAAQLGIAPARLIGPKQIHSSKAVIVRQAWEPGGAPEADAIVTDCPGLAIGVLTADCVPILLASPEAGVIAAVHAGWKGAKAGVIENAIEAMQSLGAQPAQIVAAIGPAISQAAYEVSPEFEAAFLAEAGANRAYFSQMAGARPHFNLTAYVKDRLLRCGAIGIQDVGTCTYENESILFSYRRSVHKEEPDYGRQISAILLG
jgi:YfiH family protein